MAYEITLPPQLANPHNLLRVSQLRKYIPNPSHVLEMDEVQIKDKLCFEAILVRIEYHRVNNSEARSLVW